MKIANVEEQIRMLVELQELDAEIFGKKRILELAPEKTKEMDAILEEKTGRLKALEEELKDIQLKRKEKEVDLAAKEASIKKYEAQLTQVKTNKEYSVLQKEIADIKADNSILEEEIIGFLEKIETVEKDIAKERELLAVEKKKIDSEKKKIEEEIKAIQAEFDELNKKRQEFTAKVDKNLLSRYEKILYKTDGLAMVEIVDGACGGCNMNLPPQVVNETRLKKEVTFCGNCARILYSKD
ncbi:MAG: C4-type zinc ribbon domain-containing protein [Candidatus Omnitrophota bacterium]